MLASLLQLVDDGATHVGVATDHVIESFRNDLWAGYKSSAGMPPELLAQFPLVEQVLAAAGFTVWPQVEYEADDGMAAAAALAAADERVSRVLICTPDKDLGQCVGGKVVQFDRRKGEIFDADGVRARLGVPPESVPDLLAPGRRLGRRVPRAARLGREVGGGGAEPVGAPGGHPGRPGRLGRSPCAARPS